MGDRAIVRNDGVCESKEKDSPPIIETIIKCPNDSLWESITAGSHVDYEQWEWSCYCINCSFSPIFKKTKATNQPQKNIVYKKDDCDKDGFPLEFASNNYILEANHVKNMSAKNRAVVYITQYNNGNQIMLKQMMEYNHALLVSILESIMNSKHKTKEILNLRRDLLYEWAELY